MAKWDKQSGAALVSILLLIAGCTSEGSSSSTPNDEPTQGTTAIGLMGGEWIVEAVDSVDPSREGKELLLRVNADSDGLSLSLGFEGCSHYGGSAESLSPVVLTSTTVEGVGGCGEEDGVARGLLWRLNGAQFQSLESGEAVLEADGLKLSLSRR